MSDEKKPRWADHAMVTEILLRVKAARRESDEALEEFWQEYSNLKIRPADPEAPDVADQALLKTQLAMWVEEVGKRTFDTEDQLLAYVDSLTLDEAKALYMVLNGRGIKFDPHALEAWRKKIKEVR